MDEYLSGDKLFGDDFKIKEIKEWYDAEKEGYSNLDEINDYRYQFHYLNRLHGYAKLRKVPNFHKVLALGAAYGDEVLPIIDKIDELYIIEPSEKLRSKKISDKIPIYVTPEISGKIMFPGSYFNLVTCFGVLHHIPNVSFVFQEMVRVTKPGGVILIREPIVSMGDWRKPRKGLTKSERGIPHTIFNKMITDNNINIISEHKVLFPITRRINLKDSDSFKAKVIFKIDYLLSLIFSWNNRYHCTNFLHKVRPQSIFYVLHKMW